MNEITAYLNNLIRNAYRSGFQDGQSIEDRKYVRTKDYLHRNKKEIGELNKIIVLSQKETAKNVRHKAIDLALDVCNVINDSPYYNLPTHLAPNIQERIMNIQFKDIAPKGVLKQECICKGHKQIYNIEDDEVIDCPSCVGGIDEIKK